MEVVQLHVQSGYSLLDSTCKLEDLVIRAKQRGYEALALTDENVLYGAIPFYKLCKRNGLKPIIGMLTSIESFVHDQGEHSIVLLAETNEGYQNLMKLSSHIQTKHQPVSKQLLDLHKRGLIAITPGVEGEVESLLLAGDLENARKCLSEYMDVFGREHLFLAIQDHGSKQEEQLRLDMLKLCEDDGVEPVATNQVRFLEKGDELVLDCLHAVRDGRKLGEMKKTKSAFYLKSVQEMLDQFAEYPVALRNTANIAKRCTVDLGEKKLTLPKYPVPNGGDATGYLRELCERGFRYRYKQDDGSIKRRLDYELAVIERMNFSDYFLIVWDFMRFAHQNGIKTGPGRGSAAGSLVAYVLRITDVDPIKHHLLFERFLNPERVSMPDIDIDFPDTRRDEIIQYVHRKYGNDHVAQIITFGTLAARAAIRDVGRVLDISPKEVDFIAKQVPGRPGITLKQAYEESALLRDRIKQSDKALQLFKLALKIEGLPRHASTHAAGVVISANPLTDTVPLQSGHGSIHLTQYSMDILEEVGLLKMDFLGLRNLTLIDTIVRLIANKTGQTVSLQTISFHDQKTFRLLADGDTTGVFQLESSGMRQVLKQLEPTEFEDIVAVNALYRPGPMENIPTYIKRKHGEQPITYAHPDLEEILQPTYGVIVYQEQIMQIASKMAGFSLGEADLLRRAVSKKKKKILDKEREHFLNGAIHNGYEHQVANDIYDLIVRFADYGFNRSHAVAYSMIAYQLAYLKANYPLFFMAALLTSVIGNDEKTAQYVGEAKHKGLTVLPPSINSSWRVFTVEERGIRFGLQAIKAAGTIVVNEILEKRKDGGAFKDLFDFCARVSTKTVNRRVIESLICSGCFDEFGVDRAVLLASIDSALEYAELAGGDGEFGFFLSEEIVPKPEYVRVAPFELNDRLRLEKETLGFYLSRHPVEPYKSSLAHLTITAAVELDISNSSKQVQLAGYVSDARTLRTKKGELMAFLTLSDETGEVELVAFPDSYRQFGPILQKDELLLVAGKAEQRNNRLQVIVKKAALLEHAVNQATLYLRIDHDSVDRTDKTHVVKAILKDDPGNIPVIVHYAQEQRTVRLSEKWMVSGNPACLRRLEEVLGTGNVVLKKD